MKDFILRYLKERVITMKLFTIIARKIELFILASIYFFELGVSHFFSFYFEIFIKSFIRNGLSLSELTIKNRGCFF